MAHRRVEQRAALARLLEALPLTPGHEETEPPWAYVDVVEESVEDDAGYVDGGSLLVSTIELTVVAATEDERDGLFAAAEAAFNADPAVGGAFDDVVYRGFEADAVENGIGGTQTWAGQNEIG